MLTPAPARERVARGAHFLDRYDPQWHQKVDPERLNIASGRDCIWGQLTGNYDKRPWQLRLAAFLGRNRQLGFLPDDEFWDLDAGHLNRAWREAIKVRRDRDASPAGA